jgi:hypothetical protein
MWLPSLLAILERAQYMAPLQHEGCCRGPLGNPPRYQPGESLPSPMIPVVGGNNHHRAQKKPSGLGSQDIGHPVRPREERTSCGFPGIAPGSRRTSTAISKFPELPAPRRLHCNDPDEESVRARQRRMRNTQCLAPLIAAQLKGRVTFLGHVAWQISHAKAAQPSPEGPIGFARRALRSGSERLPVLACCGCRPQPRDCFQPQLVNQGEGWKTH